MKINLKKFIVLALTAALLILPAGCGGKEEEKAAAEQKDAPKKIELRLGHVVGDDAHFGRGAKKFKEEVEKRTNGQLIISIFPSSQLGGEREIVEGQKIGSIDMGVTTTGTMGSFLKDFNVFDMPYLFSSREHAHAVLDGPIGDEFAKKFEAAADIKILGWMEGGFRAEINRVRPVKTAADMKKIKYRVVENKVQIDTFKAFGADATPMAYGEVYTSIQQGVIDGAVSPFPGLWDGKFHEVAKYASYIQDMYTAVPITISKKKFDSLPADFQTAIVEAAKVAVPYQREQCEIIKNEVIEKYKAAGVTVTMPDDLSSFKKAVESVYTTWAPTIGQDLIDKIKNYKY